MSPRIFCLDKSLFTRNGKIWLGSESANELRDGCGRSPRSTSSYSSRRGPAWELRARTERRNRGQNVMSRNICHELSRGWDRVRLDLKQGDGHIYSNKLLWHGPGRDGGFLLGMSCAFHWLSGGSYINIIGHQLTGCGKQTRKYFRT